MPSKTNVVSGYEYAQQNWAGHQQYVPNDLRYQSLPTGSTCSMGGVGSNSCSVPQQMCSNPEPGAYYPYSGGNASAAFDSSYPNEEDMSSLAPRGCGGMGAGQGAQDFALSVNSLMPASWRGGPQASTELDGSQWAKYAPSKGAFDRYITAQGSARLTLTTRSPLSRQIGVSDLTRPAPPMPLAADNIVFNDSSFRQDLVFNQMGRYPNSTTC